MENASKALIMAGGILIGIILITIGVYLFNKAAAIPKEYNSRLEKDRLAAFNEKYEAYNRNDVTAQDIVTVINMADQNNSKYLDTEVDYRVTVELDGTLLNGYNEVQKIEMLQATSVTEDNTLYYPYYCSEIKYSSLTGRVISIAFKKQ